jgi:hypothetical protein
LISFCVGPLLHPAIQTDRTTSAARSVTFRFIVVSSGRRAVDEGQKLRAERVTDDGQAGDDSVAARPFLLLPIFRPALM